MIGSNQATRRRPGRSRWGHTTRGLTLLVIVAGIGFFAASRPTPATIRGSAHDFSGLDESQQICIFCHTTHNADMTVTDAPLWNHDVTTKNYQLYNSPTMDGTPSQPAGASRLCLSCHDGTIAVDSYGDRTGVIFMGGDVAIGADELSNDHPVSFVYDDALAVRDRELFLPSSSPSGLGGTLAQDLLFGNQLECSSCHDVHNGPAAAAVNDSLLVVTQVQSQLCLTCHKK